MGDHGTEPKLPQVQFLEPSHHQASVGPFLKCNTAGKGVGAGFTLCHGIMEKLRDKTPLGALSLP
jgi:hypothetical protein